MNDYKCLMITYTLNIHINVYLHKLKFTDFGILFCTLIVEYSSYIFKQ